ncbi:decarboxylating 6-phosphogluconate dehydrogenase [Candidatus Woesearchaeota archaeon]|nr:decarboxylating 6-phosphogluconate dehydrogenase [Candidatus Woesearchaeota archaeon]
MKIGFIGLGRMGYNIALNLLDKKYEVVAHNRSPEPVREIARKGAIPAFTAEELCKKLPKPKIIWLMVTAGKPVDETIKKLLPCLQKDDILIDGGNSNFIDTVRRHGQLSKRGIHYLDCGTSGGLKGARYGACLTIGGNEKIFKKLEKLFKDIAAENGYLYTGPSGSGHFVKIVHNGIEYVMLEALGEGFDVLNAGPYNLNFREIADVWSHGSIIRSYLTELAVEAFKKDPKLKKIRGVVGGGETGAWVAQYAKKWNVAVPALETALKMRKLSSKKERFSGKVIAALRNEFGGHEVVKNKK